MLSYLLQMIIKENKKIYSEVGACIEREFFEQKVQETIISQGTKYGKKHSRKWGTNLEKN